MVRIICRAKDCIYWENGFCVSEEITYDPESGCLTFEGVDDILSLDDDIWEDMNADDDDLVDDFDDDDDIDDDDDDDW